MSAKTMAHQTVWMPQVTCLMARQSLRLFYRVLAILVYSSAVPGLVYLSQQTSTKVFGRRSVRMSIWREWPDNIMMPIYWLLADVLLVHRWLFRSLMLF